LGFSKDGLKDGYNQNGFTNRGFDRLGCNRHGKDALGYDCITGLNALGLDKDGFNANGINPKTGRDRLGRDSEGFYEDGFNDSNIDRYGCDREGMDENGEPCSNEVNFNLNLGEEALLNNYVRYQVAMAQAIEAENNLVAVPSFGKGIKRVESIPDATQQQTQGQPSIGGLEGISGLPTTPIAGSGSVSSTEANESSSTDLPVRIPSLTTMKARIACEINTDYKGDTCAEIMDGPLAGAMLRGTYDVPYIDRVDMPRDKIQISFDRLIWRRQQIDIQAVAINMDTFSEFMSSDVNYHRAYRWGGLAMATAIDLTQGYIIGSAASGSASSDAESAGTAMAIQMAASEPLKEMSDLYRGRMDRPPTVTMFIDEQIGIMFNEQVVDERVPFVFSDR